MSLRMRLSRSGAKKRPYYRIVIADSRMPRDGRFIESIGRYDPSQEPAFIGIDLEKARAWMAKGAIPTRTVRNLLDKAGIND